MAVLRRHNHENKERGVGFPPFSRPGVITGSHSSSKQHRGPWKPPTCTGTSRGHHNNNKRSRVDMEDTDTSPSSTPKTLGVIQGVQSIFGSPPEPLFNQQGSSILLKESLEALSLVSSQNQFSVKGDKCQGVYRTGQPVAYFMYMTKHFNLPADIQYRAIELFHRFMTRHVCELYDHVQSTKHSSTPIKWEQVEQRLTHQVTLRALSCLQLASKLSLHYKIISLGRARNFLATCGFRYASSSLVQSEIRVLKTLDYRVHGPTPLDFIEVLLEALGHNDSSLPIKQLYGISMKLLDAYYLSTPDIMEKLKQFSLTSSSVKGVPPSRSSKNDSPSLGFNPQSDYSPNNSTVNFLLLAAGIIGASSFLLDHTTSDRVVENIASISQISSENILDISALLVEYIMTE